MCNSGIPRKPGIPRILRTPKSRGPRESMDNKELQENILKNTRGPGRHKASRPKIVRKTKTSKLDDSTKWLILQRYLKGESSSVMAEEYKVTGDDMRNFLKTICKNIIELHETKDLMRTQGLLSHIVHTKDPKYINEDFKALVSRDHEPLTDQEMLYCFLYVENGCNNRMALEGSGLDVGLTVKTRAMVYDLRGQFLRAKENVKNEIRALRKVYTDNFEVTKVQLQGELVDLLLQLKHSGKNEGLLLKVIELLGRSENTWQTQVNVSTVSPEEELKKLMTMVKKDGAYHATP